LNGGARADDAAGGDDIGIIEHVIFGVDGVCRDIYQHRRQTVRRLAGHLIGKPYLVSVEHKIGHIRGVIECPVGPLAGLAFSLQRCIATARRSSNSRETARKQPNPR